MQNLNDRFVAINKIAESIDKALTFEQIVSTEKYFTYYFNNFGFDSHFLRQEWLLDTKIREKKQNLALIEGNQQITFDKQKPSLKRLEEYARTVSNRELKTIWPELKIQLRDISSVEISYFPAVCRLLSNVYESSKNEYIPEKISYVANEPARTTQITPIHMDSTWYGSLINTPLTLFKQLTVR